MALLPYKAHIMGRPTIGFWAPNDDTDNCGGGLATEIVQA
jgi:hypothetical protein